MTVENNVTFLEHLRAHTADSHKNLESLPVSVSITSPNVTAEAYAHYLNLMSDVIKDTEDHIFALLENIFPDLEERRKSQLLDADLAFLNYTKTNFSKPFTNTISEFSIPFAMGILYVVEGSSLGGRFILKNLQSALGYEENGVTYFNGYGNKTGSSWKNFLNILTSYEATHNNGDQIVAGADFAFKAIHQHFSN